MPPLRLGEEIPILKAYRTSEIRNVALAGHSHSGKTSLAEALPWVLKQTERLGRVEDGTTLSDYDQEEIRRQCSIQASVVPVEHGKQKINVIDLPGFRDFIGEIKRGLRMADATVLVIDATGGLDTGALFAWDAAAEFRRPRLAFVNKLDKEHAVFQKTVDLLRDGLGTRVVPITLPVGEGLGFSAVIDLIKMKLVREEGQKVAVEEIPAELAAAAQAAHAAMVEAAAEGDDELTMKYLEQETLAPDEITRGLKESLIEGRFLPVFAGSATMLKGLASLLDFIVECTPDPSENDGYACEVDGKEEMVKVSPEGSAAMYVFKTVADPYVGRLSFFKVIRGKARSDMSVMNAQQGKTEKLGHLLVAKGKKTETVEELAAGDIGAVAKIESTRTNDTLLEPGGPVIKVTSIHLPNPTTFRAVVAKSRADEDKIGLAIHKLVAQDPTLAMRRDPDINQTILSGMGETHLDVAVGRLKDLAGIEIKLEVPRVPYRETITRKAEGQGKHKKQSGGHGQYGDCWVRFEPLPEGSGFEFEWGIVGGVIPTNYQSAVEKGLVESLRKGVLAGAQTVDLKAICYDGSYHAVDSSDMAFKVAASLAFKNVVPKCAPILLEPIYKLTVTVPEEYMGDVMGDLNGRRGRIQGMEAGGKTQVITAQAPLAELHTYGRALNSLTQGRGVFDMEFDHYERMPGEAQEKVVAEAKKQMTEEEA
jgi:elongation factor G